MNFYLLKRPPRADTKVPFGTTAAHRGCKIVECEACGTLGMVPKSQLGRVPVEILVKDVAYLDDIEQASSVLLASAKFRHAVSAPGLTGIEFYPPVGYQARRKGKRFEEMIRKCQDEYAFQVMHFTGNGGSVAETSGIELVKSCDVCGWREWTLPKNGYHVDEDQWDGTDFFRVKEQGSFMMSQRAVDVLSNAGLSNFGAMRASEYRSPF